MECFICHEEFSPEPSRLREKMENGSFDPTDYVCDPCKEAHTLTEELLAQEAEAHLYDELFEEEAKKKHVVAMWTTATITRHDGEHMTEEDMDKVLDAAIAWLVDNGYGMDSTSKLVIE